MKKNYLIYLIFAVSILFASCGKKDQTETTLKNVPETTVTVAKTPTATVPATSATEVSASEPPASETEPSQSAELPTEEPPPTPVIEATSDAFEVQVVFKTTAQATQTSQATQEVTTAPTPAPTPTPTPEPTPAPEPVKQVVRNAPYSFAFKGVSIALGANADDVTSRLGEPNSVFEAASCAVVGLDKNFYYSGVEVYAAYPDGADGYISSIIITGSAKTPEGAGNGMTREQIEAIYGSDYADMGASISYTYGNTELQFIFEGGSVAQTAYYLQ